LFENVQKADKEFFNAKEYLKPEDRELVLSITKGDVFTYKVAELLNQFLSYSRQNRPDEDVNIYKPSLQDLYNGLKIYNASVFPIQGFQVDKPSNDIYDQSESLKNREVAVGYLKKLPKIVIRNLKHITQAEYTHKSQLENVARELKSIVQFLQHVHESVDEESYARVIQKAFNSKNILNLEEYKEKLEELLHVETFDMRNIDLQEVKNKAIEVGAEVIQEGEDFLLIAVTEAYELREISCAVHWCVVGESYFSNHTTVIPEMYMLLQASSQVKNEDRLLLYTESDGMDYGDVETVKREGMPEMEWYNAVNESTYPFVSIDEEGLIERVRALTAEHIDDYIEQFGYEDEEELSMVAEIVKRKIYESIKGGLADNKTVEDIAKKHGVSVEKIEKQIEMGMKVEMEHVDDKEKAKEISMDHLWEIPDYYDRLDNMEKEAESTKSTDEDPYFYHATYTPVVPLIQKNGLGGGSWVKAWSDSKEGVVYLAKDPYVAYSYAETSEEVPEEWLDHIVILKIKKDTLDPEKIKSDNNVIGDQDTLEYHGVIPWKALRPTTFNNLEEVNPVIAVDDIPNGADMKPVHEEWDYDEDKMIYHTVSIDGEFYHGTMEDRGEIPNLQTGYYDWDALWFSTEPDVADQFSDYRGGEGVHVMWVANIKSDKIVYLNEQDFNDIKEHYGYEDLREAIHMFEQQGFDGWQTLGSIDWTQYDDFAIWNEDIIDYIGVRLKINGEWTDVMSKDDAEEMLAQTRGEQEIDEANPIVAINDLPKGHFERTTNIVSI